MNTPSSATALHATPLRNSTKSSINTQDIVPPLDLTLHDTFVSAGLDPDKRKSSRHSSPSSSGSSSGSSRQSTPRPSTPGLSASTPNRKERQVSRSPGSSPPKNWQKKTRKGAGK